MRLDELNNPAFWNKRIELLKLEKEDNKVGGARNEQWVHQQTVWANIHTFGGNERFELSQSVAELTHRIVIRYRKDMDRKMRMKYRDREFEIDYIVNLEEANRFLILHVVERV